MAKVRSETITSPSLDSSILNCEVSSVWPTTTTNNQEDFKESYNQIISDELAWYLEVYLVILVGGIISAFGVVNNGISCYIFQRLGLRDSMSIGLVSLALTDLFLSFVLLASRVFFIWSLFFKPATLEPQDLAYVSLAWIKDSLFLGSGWITALLSVERCVCVTNPFKVRQWFTRTRTLIAIVVIHVTTTATYIPIYASLWLAWVTVEGTDGVPANNSSYNNSSSSSLYSTRRLVVMRSDNQKDIEYYVEIINATVIPLPSAIIILVSVFWMIHGLEKSHRFRKCMTNVEDNNNARNNVGQDSSLSSKTKRLVKVVLALAIMYTICNIPRTYSTLVNIINPEVNYGGKEKNLSAFQWKLSRMFSALNASMNCFVYLTVSSSYRAKFREIFAFRCG